MSDDDRPPGLTIRVIYEDLPDLIEIEARIVFGENIGSRTESVRRLVMEVPVEPDPHWKTVAVSSCSSPDVPHEKDTYCQHQGGHDQGRQPGDFP